jgi:hypothetical protein
MKNQEIRTLDTLKRTDAFHAANAADFAATSLGAKQFAIITDAVMQAGALGAAQLSAGSETHSSVLSKATLRLLIQDDLVHINRAAHSLALLGTPGVDGEFRMPRGNGDQKLLNAARAFITEATPLKAQFIQLSLPDDFLDTLQTHTDGFETCIKSKAAGKQTRAGATTGIADTVHNAVIALHVVDTIVRNTYKNDPQKLAEWTVASHVERAAKKAAKPASAPAK